MDDFTFVVDNVASIEMIKVAYARPELDCGRREKKS